MIEPISLSAVVLAAISLFSSIVTGIVQILSNGKNEITFKSSCCTSSDDHHIEIKKANSGKK